MKNHVNLLTHNLNLSPYQSNKLMLNYELYNMSRLEKRGGVLFVPYRTSGLLGQLGRFLFGVRADLIGENKTLLQAQRNIKFCANGYHSVRVGRYTYYANAAGNIISPDEFFKNTDC